MTTKKKVANAFARLELELARAEKKPTTVEFLIGRLRDAFGAERDIIEASLGYEAR